jgi:hypothetical protein
MAEVEQFLLHWAGDGQDANLNSERSASGVVVFVQRDFGYQALVG